MTSFTSRRNVLRASAGGFGAVAAEWLMQRDAMAAAKLPHFAPKAKSVIFLFMVGAPSSMDTFDPKPALKKYEGQPLPASFGKVGGQFTDGSNPLLASPWDFKQYGKNGTYRYGTHKAF